MSRDAFTSDFEGKVLQKRPYITRQVCIRVLRAPLKREPQPDGNRVRFWGGVPDRRSTP